MLLHKRELCKAHDRLADVHQKSLNPWYTFTPVAQWYRNYRILDKKQCVFVFVVTLEGMC